MAKSKEILVEFIPFGGKDVTQSHDKKKVIFKRKEFKSYFKKSYKHSPGARFGKATDRGRKGWGIFIPRR